jgi:hypothetical protein
MAVALWRSLQFLWIATRGHRLRPWRSDYLRWRVETYSGKPAATVRLSDFTRMIFSEHRQLRRFARWTGEIHELAHSSYVPAHSSEAKKK